MARTGATPDKIRARVVDTLAPHFVNPEVLSELAIKTLLPEAVNMSILYEDDWALGMYQHCLTTHRLAQANHGLEAIRISVSWEPLISQGLSEYWSLLHLEFPKDELPLEEFKTETIRTIGALIEAVIQPFLRELLHMIRLRDSIKDAVAPPDRMTLGNIVDELMKSSRFPDLFAPPPWGVRLNQWRNVADHHSARVDGNEIVCSYGHPPRLCAIRLSRIQLLSVAKMMVNIVRAVNLARTLFLVDNRRDAKDYLPQIVRRAEDQMMNFTLGVASQGFEVMDVRITDEESFVSLKDITPLDPSLRVGHATQLVYQLWVHTQRKRISIEYVEHDGTLNLLATVTSDVCEQARTGKLDRRAFLDLVEMTDLKTGIRLPKLP